MVDKRRPINRDEFEQGVRELQAKFDEADIHLWEAYDARLISLDTESGCKEIQRYADEHQISFVDAFDLLAPTPPAVPRPVKAELPTEVKLDESDLNRRAVALAEKEGVTLDEAIDRTLEGQ